MIHFWLQYREFGFKCLSWVNHPAIPAGISNSIAFFGFSLWYFSVHMTSRLHSANTLREGMNQVAFGDDPQARKRDLENRIAVTRQQIQSYMIHMCNAWGYLPIEYFHRNLFAFKESRQRVEALRRKMSNQASTLSPEVPVPGYLAAPWV